MGEAFFLIYGYRAKYWLQYQAVCWKSWEIIGERVNFSYIGIEPRKRVGQLVNKREERNLYYTKVKYSACVCNRRVHSLEFITTCKDPYMNVNDYDRLRNMMPYPQS